jgi:hypothetical protein
MVTNKSEQFWLGIDFSGDYKKWRANERESNIYIATVRAQPKGFLLTALQSVQQLGEGVPFQNLVTRLKARDFKAAAIDAPFSVPSKYLPLGATRRSLDKLGPWSVHRIGRFRQVGISRAAFSPDDPY